MQLEYRLIVKKVTEETSAEGIFYFDEKSFVNSRLYGVRPVGPVMLQCKPYSKEPGDMPVNWMDVPLAFEKYGD